MSQVPSSKLFSNAKALVRKIKEFQVNENVQYLRRGEPFGLAQVNSTRLVLFGKAKPQLIQAQSAQFLRQISMDTV